MHTSWAEAGCCAEPVAIAARKGRDVKEETGVLEQLGVVLPVWSPNVTCEGPAGSLKTESWDSGSHANKKFANYAVTGKKFCKALNQRSMRSTEELEQKERELAHLRQRVALLEQEVADARRREQHAAATTTGQAGPPPPRSYACNHSLSKEQVQRYSRHLLLPSFGLNAQERLCKGSVLIVGCGGLGSPAALYLAASGVGKLLSDMMLTQRSNMFSIVSCAGEILMHALYYGTDACTEHFKPINTRVPFIHGETAHSKPAAPEHASALLLPPGTLGLVDHDVVDLSNLHRQCKVHSAHKPSSKLPYFVDTDACVLRKKDVHVERFNCTLCQSVL
eukprot:1151487-Pelagomonas_calceolata.AAC.6